LSNPDFRSQVVGCLSYWLVGFALAWSEGNAFIGWHHFAFVDLPPDKVSLAFYQLIFSNTASTIVTGAVAERFNLPGRVLSLVRDCENP